MRDKNRKYYVVVEVNRDLGDGYDEYLDKAEFQFYEDALAFKLSRAYDEIKYWNGGKWYYNVTNAIQMTADEILEKHYFNTNDERSTLIAKIAMREYAKDKVDSQRKLFQDAFDKMIGFRDESERSNFIIEIMQKTEYPNFD